MLVMASMPWWLQFDHVPRHEYESLARLLKAQQFDSVAPERQAAR